MNSRKKLIISLSSLGLAIVAAIGITFGVLAAQTQTVTNTFTVSYQANNVAASAYAKYKKKNDLSYTYFTGGNDTFNVDQNTAVAALTFVPSQSSNSSNPGTLQVEGTGLQLAADNEYAILAFAFHNNASSGGNSIKVKLIDSAAINPGDVQNELPGTTNVKIYHYVSTNDNETVANIKGSVLYTQVQWDALTEEEDADEVSALYTQKFPSGEASTFAEKKAALAAVPGVIIPANQFSGSSAKVLTTEAALPNGIAPQATAYVYILVEIDDDTLGANYVSNSAGGLSWVINDNSQAFPA